MASQDQTRAAIDLRLALLGLPSPTADSPDTIAAPLVARARELRRRLRDTLCPADQRIQDFLDDYLAGTGIRPTLPSRTLVLDQPGLARELSLPVDSDEFHSDLLASYRLHNGVLHNPANDRRTTAGAFHIVEGGLPIPDDKIAVSREVYARLLNSALSPDNASLELPYTANLEQPARTFVSLLLRPLVVPQAEGFNQELSLETRFFVPGGLVCNLDFVEEIFGNAGDPLLPENDAELAPEGWTGHTGCVILAPHLVNLTKAELGLPHIDEATERQRRDGQCWSDPAERYNDGKAFKVTARDERGVMVTVIADNYFGYCKKEIKTQISYSANLLGCAEEEHAGGAIVYPAWNLGSKFVDETPAGYTFDDVVARDAHFEVQAEGYARYQGLPGVLLVPERTTYDLQTRTVSWNHHGQAGSIPLRADEVYLSPNGYRVHAKHRELDETQWHLVGTAPNATHCHKPATVSGGGKSEISKSLMNAVVFAHAYTPNFDVDMDTIQGLLERDYSQRFADAARNGVDHRSILDPARTLGSVIKLLTPSKQFNAEHNSFLQDLPPHISELVFLVKRYYQPEWGDDWRSHFSVGILNGRMGNVLRLDEERVVVNMLRVGFHDDGSWRLFSLRNDFSPAAKVQTEDDITASTVVPGEGGVSRKYVKNCEQRLFQRPDDAVHRGFDRQTEVDMTLPGTFISNFEPLTVDDARDLRDDMVSFSQFTAPMKEFITSVATSSQGPQFFVCSALPRLVDGKPSKNPRYLQQRPDLTDPRSTCLADLASHLYLKVPTSIDLQLPVDVVAAGRRNNPPEDGVPPLCAYNPLHYMELPELLMEYISSMTGKSPSTTGAGSEGAMTKGPFNALPTIADLNTALVAYALCESDGWLSGAGVIGPKVRVDHDISMLIPELFSRMSPTERTASALIEAGMLDKIEDLHVDGRTVEASRLGYRINERFVTTYFARIFQRPDMVFTEEMLRPELQDEAVFAESVDVIVTTHQRVAQAYVDDGTINLAVPPLRALLECMISGASSEGYTLDSPELRNQFTREGVLSSSWYRERLQRMQDQATARWERSLKAMHYWIENNPDEATRLSLQDRVDAVQAELHRLHSPDCVESLIGRTGAESWLPTNIASFFAQHTDALSEY